MLVALGATFTVLGRDGERRLGRVRERLLEETVRGTLRVETRGSRVGAVNGLAVLDLGRFVFGRPTRITARVRLGKGDVVDIEREAELSGPIHAKGVMILSGYLAGRYALPMGMLTGNCCWTARLCLAEVPRMRRFHRKCQ